MMASKDFYIGVIDVDDIDTIAKELKRFLEYGFTYADETIEEAQAHMAETDAALQAVDPTVNIAELYPKSGLVKVTLTNYEGAAVTVQLDDIDD